MFVSFQRQMGMGFHIFGCCRQCEQRSRQYEEETSVIMKTEELRGGQEMQRKEKQIISIKNCAMPAKQKEQEKFNKNKKYGTVK